MIEPQSPSFEDEEDGEAIPESLEYHGEESHAELVHNLERFAEVDSYSTGTSCAVFGRRDVLSAFLALHGLPFGSNLDHLFSAAFFANSLQFQGGLDG